MSIKNTPSPLKASTEVTRAYESIFNFNRLPSLSAQQRGQLGGLIRNTSEEQSQAYLEKKEKSMARSRAAMTFPKFRKLPPELRLRIWSFAGPGPRIIRQYMAIKHIGSQYVKSLGYQQSTPAVLSACKESREVYLWAWRAPVIKYRSYVQFNKDPFSR